MIIKNNNNDIQVVCLCRPMYIGFVYIDEDCQVYIISSFSIIIENNEYKFIKC